MYECLSNFEVIPRSTIVVANQPGATAPFLSVHLCEAPGAFISATNHFIHTNYTHIEVTLFSFRKQVYKI
jgi:cap2 methyltransferase